MSSWFVICLSVLRLAACLAGLLHWFLFVVLIASNCAVFPDFLFGAWWSWRDLGLHDDLHLLNGGTLSLAHFPFWTRPMGTGAAPHGPGHQAGPPMLHNGIKDIQEYQLLSADSATTSWYFSTMIWNVPANYGNYAYFLWLLTLKFKVWVWLAWCHPFHLLLHFGLPIRTQGIFGFQTMHMASQHLRGLRTHQRQGEQHQELHLLKVSLKQQEPQTSLWGNIGSKTRNIMTIRRWMDWPSPQLLRLQAGLSSRTLKDATPSLYHWANCATRAVKIFVSENWPLDVKSMWQLWVKSARWSLLVRCFPKFEIVVLIWTDLLNTKLSKMDILWRKEKPSNTSTNSLIHGHNTR